MPRTTAVRLGSLLTAALLTAIGAGVLAGPAHAVSPVSAPERAVVMVPSAPAVGGAIRAKWLSLGGSGGFLGHPTSHERRLRDGGASQSFQGGQIHWSPGNGAHVTKGGIRKTWAVLGWENGFLGYPTSDERRLRSGGASQSFQGGQIHWSAASGAHATRGAIQRKWASAGWENGSLRYPTSHERRLRDGGASQSFQGGQIHWSPGNGAHITRGAIQRTWAASGWQDGRYGYPVGDEYRTPTGAAQRFEGGTITWTDPAKRVHSGYGDDVISITKPDGPGSMAVVEATHDGSSNFIVWGQDAGYADTDLLVNDIGTYSGSMLLDEDDWGAPTVRLRITADGAWTISVRSVNSLPSYGADRTVSGRGSSVFRYSGRSTTRQINHTGNSNFIVWSYPNNGYADLLVNDIGTYSGRVAYPGPAVIEVEADGSWSIRP
ncbi:LGFP repeat-containing protein [Kocuria flava]|nr:hypothetical protein [Kocuria flava]